MDASAEASMQVDDRGRKIREALCTTHGAYVSANVWRDMWSGCATCAAESAAREKAEQERLDEEHRRRDWMSDSGLIGRYRDCTFDNFVANSAEQRKVLAACQQQYAATLTGDAWAPLWLIGSPGTGKSHLAAAIARHAMFDLRRRALVTTARDIVRRLRATWRRDASQTEGDVLDELGGVALLVIDEIGVGFGTEAEALQLFDVIDQRYARQKALVLVSNLVAPELRVALGDRSFDRLRENALVLPCAWPSYRGRFSAPQAAA